MKKHLGCMLVFVLVASVYRLW